MTFTQILEKYRENSNSLRNQGERFEVLMKRYLLTKPEFKGILSNVWLWSEFPYKLQLNKSGKDTGIDIVAKTYSDDFWAVQCKFYDTDARISYGAVSNFYTTSNLKFDYNGEKKSFVHRIWIDTTIEGFSDEAREKISQLGISRIGYFDLKNDESVDWQALDRGEAKENRIKYGLRPHQKKAFDSTIKYFADDKNNRGKLIMACGTGKTFTSLRIAEEIAGKGRGLVLFLVPSISLLSQSLKEWCAQSKGNLYPICICSDSKASGKKGDGDAISDIILPASTDEKVIYEQFVKFQELKKQKPGTIVVFSTYQSIDCIHTVQSKINAQVQDSFVFDIVICDEAHRTTGVELSESERSAFVKIHDDEFVKADKRLYMTATPRLYSDTVKQKANEAEITLCSMDDEKIYGKEIYRIGFGKAVEKGLLSDYKVIVLTLDENSVDEKVLDNINEKIKKSIKANNFKNKEIKSDDAIKIIGCINILSKRTKFLTDKTLFTDDDPTLMKSAVAFCSNIKNSEYLKESFNLCREAYYEQLSEDEKAKMVIPSSDHIDGSMDSSVRAEKLDWLKASKTSERDCHILNNVRCLSEGVDVPSLDAILFLSSRNSQVDVVQSVGRVMRKSEGKKFGYIIIPVVVPAKADVEEILDKNADFRIVWSVLNALRAHDDRFNATVNKIELNDKRPNIISATGGSDKFCKNPINKRSNKNIGDEDKDNPDSIELIDYDDVQYRLYVQFKELQDKIYAKMVEKVGNKKYWVTWGKDVGQTAKKIIGRIENLLQSEVEFKKKFDSYLKGLRRNINPSITENDAIEMLSQHIITRPVFQALFEDGHFVKQNPVSKAFEPIVTLLEEKIDEADKRVLKNFESDVNITYKDLDNLAAKQEVIKRLYESFFKEAFPKTVEKLGIVYTPVQVVDFIIHSTEHVLNKEFGKSLSDEGVNIIDPFTGTATFITRLLQSGIIRQEDLKRKYKNEIFANEIVLLAYYIASINIENVYHELMKSNVGLFDEKTEDKYESFDGICLTDTFQLYESQYNDKSQEIIDTDVFYENTARANAQKKKPITVIIGNPPYSIGQRSANDNAQNQEYKNLEDKITETYVKTSEANLNKSAYDSYIKAFRWATDRLGKAGGIISFITNAGWLDSNGLDGFRKSLEKEFSSIYVFNLRGSVRGRSGEGAKKEGGNVFDIMTGVAVTILVKKAMG